MITAVADTHAVLWFLYGSPLLSVRAAMTMNQAGAGQHRIGVSSISLAEIVYLSEKGRIEVGAVPEVLRIMESGEVFQEVPVSSSVVRQFPKVTRVAVPDLPDRVIAATAIFLGVPVITRDRNIQASGIPFIW